MVIGNDDFDEFFTKIMHDLANAMKNRNIRGDIDFDNPLPIEEYHHGDKWESYEDKDIIAITMDLHDIVRTVDDIDIHVFDYGVDMNLVGMGGHIGKPVINFKEIFGEGIEFNKDEIKSTFKNGVLDIIMKKTGAKKKGKRIKPDG